MITLLDLSEKWISWLSFFCLARAKNMCFFSVWGRVREMGSVSRPPIPSSVGINRPALWDNVTCFTSHIFYTFLHKCSFINYLWQRKNISKLTNNFYWCPLSHHPLLFLHKDSIHLPLSATCRTLPGEW